MKDSFYPMEQPIEDSKIKKFWSGNMACVPKDVLSKHPLSQDTRSFFGGVGLPKECPLSVTFYESIRLLEPLTYEGETYLILGDDYGTKICLRSGIEDVWSVDPEGKLPKRFINRSIRHFLILLQIYLSHHKAVKAANDEEAVNIVQEMRSQFCRIDTHALVDPDSWWSVILEQTEEGLL